MVVFHIMCPCQIVLVIMFFHAVGSLVFLTNSKAYFFHAAWLVHEMFFTWSPPPSFPLSMNIKYATYMCVHIYSILDVHCSYFMEVFKTSSTTSNSIVLAGMIHVAWECYERERYEFKWNGSPMVSLLY